ncbi:MAG: hypothetical protein H0T84_03085 [Tatlockia sp.]|nr:hypothetical protein [Tatlockia sp.]
MFDKLNYYLDYPIKFLFLNSKGKALISCAQNMFKNDEFSDFIIHGPTNSKEIYDKLIRRYFGFGFLMSFIPGTEAFTARTEYFLSLLKLHEKIEKYLDEQNLKSHSPYFHLKNAHPIVLSPLYFLNNFIKIYYEILDEDEIHIDKLISNRKRNFNELISYLPIVSDIFSYNGELKELRTIQNWHKNIIHSLINPVRVISSLLRFLHLSINRIFEIGDKDLYESSISRRLLKLFSAFIFVPLRLVASLIQSSVDLVLNTIDLLLLEPIRFFYEAVEQYLDFKDEEFIYIPTEEYKGIVYINNALNRPITHNPLQSKHFTLEVMAQEGKNRYLGDRRFYVQMKNREEFSKTHNFSKMDDKLTHELTSFHSQLSEWKRVRQFGIFAQNQGIPQDICNIVGQNLADLVKNERGLIQI